VTVAPSRHPAAGAYRRRGLSRPESGMSCLRRDRHVGCPRIQSLTDGTISRSLAMAQYRDASEEARPRRTCSVRGQCPGAALDASRVAPTALPPHAAPCRALPRALASGPSLAALDLGSIDRSCAGLREVSLGEAAMAHASALIGWVPPGSPTPRRRGSLGRISSGRRAHGSGVGAVLERGLDAPSTPRWG